MLYPGFPDDDHWHCVGSGPSETRMLVVTQDSDTQTQDSGQIPAFGPSCDWLTYLLCTCNIRSRSSMITRSLALVCLDWVTIREVTNVHGRMFVDF